jgi:hypothetical protein
VVSFTSLPLYSREKAAGTHWIVGCLGPRTGLDAVLERKKNSFSAAAESRILTVQSLMKSLY